LVFGSQSRTSPSRFGFGAETDFRPALSEFAESPSGCQRRFGLLSLVRARFGLPGGRAGRQESRTGRLRRLFGRSEGLVDNVFLFHGGQVLGLDCNGFAGNYIFHGLIGNPWWLLSGGDEPGPSQTIDKSLLGSPWRIKAWRFKIWTTWIRKRPT